MRFFYLFFILSACTSAPDGVESTAPAPSAQRQGPVSSPEIKSIANVHIVALGEATGEDGRGGQRLSQQAYAIDIETDGWPGRAMEPSLQVGEHTFHKYTHPTPTTIRFVVMEAALLPSGAEAVVRYGRDEVARFVLPEGAQP